MVVVVVVELVGEVGSTAKAGQAFRSFAVI